MNTIIHYYPTTEEVINAHKELMAQWETLGEMINELASKFSHAVNTISYADHVYDTNTEQGKAFAEINECYNYLEHFSRYFN